MPTVDLCCMWWSSDSMPVFLDHYLLNSCQRAQLLSVCCPTCVCIDVFVSRCHFFVLPRIRTIFSHYGTLKFSFPQPFSNVFRFRTACWFWEWALLSNVVDVLGLEFIVCPKKKKIELYGKFLSLFHIFARCGQKISDV